MKISRILVACLIASMSSAAFAAKFNLKMGHAVNTTDGQHAAAMKLAELVKQRTNGDVEITIFPANQLGNDAAMINGVRGGTAYGRDHNPKAMTIWMAGGGCKAGHSIGSTDDRGMEAIEEVHHVRDLHVTLLRLLGLDDNKLTFYHGGRFKQLSQIGGQVIDKLIA